jgi:SET domain-containing protein
MALGAGAFIGHSSEPNCSWKADFSARKIQIFPTRYISPYEELTINYFRQSSRLSSQPHMAEMNSKTMTNLCEAEMPKAIVGKVPNFGRGLIALKNIACDEIITECPVRVIPNNQLREYYEIESLAEHTYLWGRNRNALAIGLPTFVNHSYQANSFHVTNTDRGTLSLIACRNISRGEEIFMNYNGNPDDKTPLGWDFEVKERVKRLKLNLKLSLG